jgi:hypothetical protein
MIMRMSAIVMLLALAAEPTQSPKGESVTLEGKVLLLADILNAAGVKADPEPILKQVILKSVDGRITPLLSDEASRALFLDARLRGRRVKLLAKRIPNMPYVQVVTIMVEFEGTMKTPEYYCDVCAISVRYPQICPCCQGEMELRMTPDAP